MTPLSAGSRLPATAPSMPAGRAATTGDEASAIVLAALAGVMDPEIPVISIVDLGIVREVAVHGNQVDLWLTPTYSGCPATEMINELVVAAVKAAGYDHVNVHLRLAPAWTSDWIVPTARARLLEYGIVPPACAGDHADPGELVVRPLRFQPRLACPRCGNRETEQISAFGSTACKALHRCRSCLEPFEYFKPI